MGLLCENETIDEIIVQFLLDIQSSPCDQGAVDDMCTVEVLKQSNILNKKAILSIIKERYCKQCNRHSD